MNNTAKAVFFIKSMSLQLVAKGESKIFSKNKSGILRGESQEFVPTITMATRIVTWPVQDLDS